MTSESRYTALLDANVLYPAATREVLMEVALEELYRAKWTPDIHYEWINALLRNNAHLQREKLERTRDLMDKAIPNAMITGYRCLIDSLNLPDPKDRHVLAAAIVGNCDVIVTENLKDFPISLITPFGIEVQHPDDFLANHLNLFPGRFCSAIRFARFGRINPPYTVTEYLANLMRNGLVVTVSELRQYSHLLE